MTPIFSDLRNLLSLKTPGLDLKAIESEVDENYNMGSEYISTHYSLCPWKSNPGVLHDRTVPDTTGIVSSSTTDFHSEKIGLIRVTYDPLSVLWLNNL